MNNTRTRRADWSNLPRELLTIIGERLGTRIGVLRCRAVCTSWRSTIPQFDNDYSRHLLKHPVRSKSRRRTSSGDHLTLTESPVYRLEPLDRDKKSNSSQSCRGWLVKIKGSKSGKFRLLNPLSHQQIRYTENFPKVLNLLDYRVVELSKAYNLEYADDGSDAAGIQKVIFSPYDSSLLVICDGGQLAFLELGEVRWNWLSGIYSDIILYKEKFYAINLQGQVVVIDSLNITTISRPLCRCSYGRKKKFVQIYGDLYVFSCTDPRLEVMDDDDDNGNEYYYRFSKDGGKAVGFGIYKLNEAKRDWVKVKSLVDVAVFLGKDCSFSVSAEELDGCRGNSIYFRDRTIVYSLLDEYGDELKGLRGLDIGLFNLEDFSITRLAACPGKFQAIWPAPTWFKSY